jgi:hypothetical protein
MGHLTQRLAEPIDFTPRPLVGRLHPLVVNKMTSSSDSGTLSLDTLQAGELIDVETKTRHYRIECLGGNAVRIQGHPEYCPEPTEAVLQGSVDQDGIDLGHIARGKRLVFYLQGMRPVTTSNIVAFRVDESGSTALDRCSSVN